MNSHASPNHDTEEAAVNDKHQKGYAKPNVLYNKSPKCKEVQDIMALSMVGDVVGENPYTS